MSEGVTYLYTVDGHRRLVKMLGPQLALTDSGVYDCTDGTWKPVVPSFTGHAPALPIAPMPPMPTMPIASWVEETMRAVLGLGKETTPGTAAPGTPKTPLAVPPVPPVPAVPEDPKKGKPFMKRDPIALMRRDLQRVGYVTSNERLLTQLYLLRQDTQRPKEGCPAIILDGPPGTGKTHAAKCFAKLWGADFLTLQFTRGIGIERLMSDLNIAAVIRANAAQDVNVSAMDMLNPGVLWKALLRSRTKRTILLLDEIDKAQETVDAFLLRFLNDCAIDDPSNPGHSITGNPHNLIVFITKNKERSLSEPLYRRCRRYYMEWPTPETEFHLVKQLAMQELRGQTVRGDMDGVIHALIGLAGRLRAVEDKLLKVPSTPELAHAAADAMLVPPTHRGHVVYGWLFAYLSDMREMHSDNQAFHIENLQAQFSKF